MVNPHKSSSVAVKEAYFLLGVCGHVDHGKSALIKALSGFEGDTSTQEQERGMTIDLSFSHLRGAQRTLGFVDVPGHQSLVATMISGSFALDLALLVVDALEGIKAQTLEHLLVLSILRIPVLVVISKLDRCPQTQELEKAISSVLEEYQLNTLGLFKCSIYDPSSLEVLKNFLLTHPFSKQTQDNALKDLFRLYIDRVFVVAGRGVAVSGTLLGGEIKTGQVVYIPALEKAIRIKALHQHGVEVAQAHAHQRAALLLGDVKMTQMKVGMLLSQKGVLRAFNVIDVQLLPPKNAPALKHNQEVQVQLGTLKCNAKVLLLSPPFATLIFNLKVFACFYDRLILSCSGRVWGGALVLNPIIDPLKKPLKIALLQALAVQNWTEAFSLLSQAHKKGFGLLSCLQRFGRNHAQALEIAKEIPHAILDSQAMVLYPDTALENLKRKIHEIYSHNPYALLSVKGLCAMHTGGLWVRKGVPLKQAQTKVQDTLYKHIEQAKYAPQAPYNLYDLLNIDRVVGDNALKSLCHARKVVRLCHNVFVAYGVLQEVLALMEQLLKHHGYLDIALLKTRLPLSRKFLIAYLEYFDSLGKTTNTQGKRTLES
ncbi:selenocysteine-specific translation elongation factor [Helicobacter felis]|uniref:selenocysteine-specific translation elongation factor n=1 Tax=Helicobacter felis TaxID=214 RepID=UPI001F33DB26|nr:selenocysteine-specific translation elongation factor [Helicobacter felis]